MKNSNEVKMNTAIEDTIAAGISLHGTDTEPEATYRIKFNY